MKELLKYVDIIKDIINYHYEKEVVFYNNGEWYSREHSRNITLEELAIWVQELTYHEECNEDYNDTLPCGCCSCCGCTCNDNFEYE